MNGQLWQECYCGDEPVCSMCEQCEPHCSCSHPERQKLERGLNELSEGYQLGIGQGFGSGADGDGDE